MELAVREAKARLSELIAAAENGERVVITRHRRTDKRSCVFCWTRPTSTT